MSDYDIDPDRAELITRRMAQAFAFAHDVIDDPAILEGIPDGSTLLFRDVEYRGDHVRLTAYPSPTRPGWWAARVTGPAQFATISRQWEPHVETRGTGGTWSGPTPHPESGPTAENALDALERKLRASDRGSSLAGRVARG